MYRTDTYNLRHDHGLDTTAGFVVRRTDWSAGFPAVRTEVAVVDGSTNYVHALTLVNQVRDAAGPDQYGVIDTVYVCGCDSAYAAEAMRV